MSMLAELFAKSGAFHWRDGWYFRRLQDGSVEFARVVHDRVDAMETIPAAEWASIVCVMSKDGETGDRWQQALDFHDAAK